MAIYLKQLIICAIAFAIALPPATDSQQTPLDGAIGVAADAHERDTVAPANKDVLGNCQHEKYFKSKGPKHAILVSTSRYWHNYRHSSNILSFYDVLVRNGVPRSNIVTMNSDEVACNPRNIAPGYVYNDRSRRVNLNKLYRSNYRDNQVTVESFLRVLRSAHPPFTPRSKRLKSQADSIFVFLSGHGGDGYLNFRDVDEIHTADFSKASLLLKYQNRYDNVLFSLDTCQASTLVEDIDSPNTVTLTSSQKSQNSFSHVFDGEMGVAMVDQFSYFTTKYLERVSDVYQNATIADLISSYTTRSMNSNVTTSLHKEGCNGQLPIQTFFADSKQLFYSSKTFPISASHPLVSVNDTFETLISYYRSRYVSRPHIFQNVLRPSSSIGFLTLLQNRYLLLCLLLLFLISSFLLTLTF